MMKDTYSRPPVTPRHSPVHPVLWLLVGVMVAIQALMSGAQAGWLPRIFSPVWVYTFGAFWDTKFDMALLGAAPADPQLLWSTVSHAFLHGGWLHLGMNGAVLLGLGHAITQAAGPGRMLAIFLLSAVAGAVVFGLIATVEGPLVGASGAVFGFLGTFVVWRARALRRMGLSLAPVVRLVLGLAAINLFLAIGMGASGLGVAVAWEAHLGGFVMGALLGALWSPGPRFH